ncbi:protein of unknown function [Burkholderia multivorans]
MVPRVPVDDEHARERTPKRPALAAAETVVAARARTAPRAGSATPRQPSAPPRGKRRLVRIRRTIG